MSPVKEIQWREPNEHKKICEMTVPDRLSFGDIEDIRREIEKTPKPDITADLAIELGPCGMGMPVLKSSWALNTMEPGQVLKTESGHP